MRNSPDEKLKGAVLRVGGGRGFVIEGKHDRYVVTAAHCLPHFPPAASISYSSERTYGYLLGRLGDDPAVWTECLYADPVADIAVLGTPDTQELYEEAEAYSGLTESVPALPVSDILGVGKYGWVSDAPAWLLSLNNKWISCKVSRRDRAFNISEAMDGIRGGMSGSPIMSDEGAAIGIVTASGGVAGSSEPHTEGAPNPRLIIDLPGWLLREVL